MMSIQKMISGRFTLIKTAYLYLCFMLTPRDKRLKRFYQKHKGERCFIVGLGPSLSVDDLESLRENHEICFSVNRIYRLYESTNWRPDYYFFSDKRTYFDLPHEVKSVFEDMIRKDKTQIIYSKKRGMKMPRQAVFYRSYDVQNALKNSKSKRLRKLVRPCSFSENAGKYVHDGSSCIHSAIQLAFYMGFQEIYLLGCDCDSVSKRDYCTLLNIETNGEKYREEGNEIIRDYENLQKEIREKNIPLKIYNATRGGRLEVFPRVSLEEVLLKNA